MITVFDDFEAALLYGESPEAAYDADDLGQHLMEYVERRHRFKHIIDTAGILKSPYQIMGNSTKEQENA